MMTSFGTEMVRHGRTMMIAGAALAYPFVKATKAAADFQMQMAYVSTMLLNTTMHLLPGMSEGIKELSMEFGKSTKELTDGLYMLLSAQVPAAEAMKYLRVASIASIAGFTSVENAVLGLTKMMKAYGGQLKGVEDASDFLFAVTRQGQGTFGQFVQSIPRVSGVAAIAGLRLEEMGASVANTSRLLENARRSTFALSSMFMVFGKATEGGKRAARKLGFELNTSSLRGMGLLGVLKKLGKATPEQIAEIFPRRAVRAVSALLQKPQEYLADLYIMFTRSGRSMEAFEKIAEAANFKWSKVRETINILKIEIGNHFLPIITSLGVSIKNFGPIMVDWVKNNGALVKGLAALAIALLGVGAALVVLGLAMKAASVLIWAGPWPIIAAGAVMAIMAFSDMDKGFAGFVTSIRVGGHEIKTWMTSVALDLMETWENVWKSFQDGWDFVLTALQLSWNEVFSNMRRGWAVLQTLWTATKRAGERNVARDAHEKIRDQIFQQTTFNPEERRRRLGEEARRFAKEGYEIENRHQIQAEKDIEEQGKKIVQIEAERAATREKLSNDYYAREDDRVVKLKEKLELLQNAQIALWDASQGEADEKGLFDKFVQAYLDAKKAFEELWGNTGGSVESLADKIGTLFTSPWMQAPEGTFSTITPVDPALEFARKTAENTDAINKKLPEVVGLAPG